MGTVGSIFILAGLLPLMGMIAFSPGLISMKNAAALEWVALDSYLLVEEGLLAAWILYLCPPLSVMGAIFLVGAGIVDTIEKVSKTT